MTSGKTNTILPGFEHANIEAVVTIKEGPKRGFVYAFYSSQQLMAWGPGSYQNAQHAIKYKKSNSVALPKKGFTAAIHNRNVEKPLVIGFNKKTVLPNLRYRPFF